MAPMMSTDIRNSATLAVEHFSKKTKTALSLIVQALRARIQPNSRSCFTPFGLSDPEMSQKLSPPG